MTARLTFIHALSALHAGIGQGAGVIDLPIAREKSTGLPFLPGSSLKGALRALCVEDEGTRKDICKKIFGPGALDSDPNSDYASSIQFSDQRLLLLPIRSLAGTFAWVTSPYVLRRFVRDLRDIRLDSPASIPDPRQNEDCYIDTTRSKLKITLENKTRVYLEDLDLTPKDEDATAWATWIGSKVFSEPIWQQMLAERFCIIHDDVFNFLIDNATEITTRIKLKENTKTVDTDTGGLWYEEALPCETILYGLALATPVKASGMTDKGVFDELTTLMNKAVQLGGKATVGRGICRVQMVQGGA
jgi:CRISPR-associated protein Cmr4